MDEQRNSTVARATVLASLVFVLPLLVGRAFEWVIKAVNPDGVDVSQGLAYLKPMLIVGWVAFALMLTITIAFIGRAQRREGPAAVRLPWLVLGVQIAVAVALLLVQLGLNSVTGG